MLILSQSQAKNYFKKLQSSYHNEGCGCCSSQKNYEIKGNRILNILSGESQGHRYYNVSIIAKIKKAGSN
jgi:hypothetical protein